MLNFKEFLLETSTLRTREDQHKAISRKYDKLRTNHILKHAKETNASRSDTENALRLSKKHLSPKAMSSAEPDDARSERLVKTAGRVVKKERSAKVQTHNQDARDAKILNRKHFLKTHGKAHQ